MIIIVIYIKKIPSLFFNFIFNIYLFEYYFSFYNCKLIYLIYFFNEIFRIKLSILYFDKFVIILCSTLLYQFK